MATAKTLPDQIEIFRAGRHVDDAGNAHDFSEADISAIAAGYNPAVREAPLCVGHPKSNLPAYGWVKGLIADGALLKMNPHQVEPQFAEMVQTQRYKKRSASFYPPAAANNPTPGNWYLRHVAFLGAQPPAVAGLKDIEFSEGDADAICFSEPVLTTSTTQEKSMDEETKALLAKAEKDAADAKAAQALAEAAATAANEKLTQFSEAQRVDRHAGHVSFAEAQITAGRLLPKDKGTAIAVLDALAEAQPVEFSEGDATKKVSPAEWLKSLISSTKPAVDFSEFAGAGTGTNESAKGLSDAEIDKRAKAYASKNSVSYAEALTQIVNFSA